MQWVNRRNVAIVGVMIAASGVALVAVTIAQTPPPAPPVPVVVGRDAREASQVIGKEYQLRVRLIDVAGPGVQQVRVVRVAPDGTVTLPRIAPLKAEGVALATLEAQATAAYKAVSPTAAAAISVADKTPPPPPPPPPPPSAAPAPAPLPPPVAPAAKPPAPATAPAATQATSKPATPAAVATAASKPATAPAVK
jgi:hypothetical protein